MSMDTFIKTALPSFLPLRKSRHPLLSTITMDVKMSPPHISDMPQPSVAQAYPQGAQDAQNAAIVAQNYRDQCQFHFFLFCA